MTVSSLARPPVEKQAAGSPATRSEQAEFAASVIIPRNGLDLPDHLPFNRWLNIGQQLSTISTSSAWCLGDWLIFGMRAYSGRYRNAIEQTSLDYQTLRNYAWVARHFSPHRRRELLSFGHHAEVTALPEPEQDFWLRKAEELGWSVKQLRREVRESLRERGPANQMEAAADHGTSELQVAKLHIEVSADQLESCRTAANIAGLSIEDWAKRALRQAASRSVKWNGQID